MKNRSFDSGFFVLSMNLADFFGEVGNIGPKPNHFIGVRVVISLALAQLYYLQDTTINISTILLIRK